MADSIFEGIKDASIGFQSTYEKEGNYFERIDGVKMGKNREGRHYVAIEKTIIKVLSDGDGKGHRLGELVTHVISMRPDTFLKNVKQFISATMEADPDEIDESDCEAICSEAQPLTGLVVEVFNKVIETKRETLFTLITYKRQVPAEEICEALSDQEFSRFFPDGVAEL